MIILLCMFLSITTIVHGSEKEYLNLMNTNTLSNNHNFSENNDFSINSNYNSIHFTTSNPKFLYYEDSIYYLRENNPQQPKNYKALCCGCISCSALLSIIGFFVFQSP